MMNRLQILHSNQLVPVHLGVFVNAALLYPPAMSMYRHGGYGPNPNAIMTTSGYTTAVGIGGGGSDRGSGGGGSDLIVDASRRGAVTINGDSGGGGGGSSDPYACEPRYPDADESGAAVNTAVPCCVYAVSPWAWYHGRAVRLKQ
jgi:hypothetical protein